MLTFD
jgi:hypothetical protein